MGWTAKVKNSVSYADMTTLSDALAYRVDWQMNRPATVDVLMNDDSGGNTQTYGSAYLGKSAVLIEQPTNTEIFRGRLVAAEPDIRRGTLLLRGEDWLSQLKDRLVIYDTREILDPNGTNSIRQAQLYPYRDAGVRTNAVIEAAGDSELRLMTTDLGDWNADDYNTMKVCFPLTHLGTQTDTLYAYDESVTGNGTKDTDDGDESDTWVNDANCHHVVYSRVGAEPDLYLYYKFKSLTASSGKVASIEAMRVTIEYELTDDACSGVHPDGSVYVDVDVAAGPIGDERLGTCALDSDSRVSKTITFNDTALELVDNDADWAVLISRRGAVGGTVGIKVYYIAVEIDYTVTSPLTTQYTIDDTQNVAGTWNELELDGDTLVTDGVIDWWEFFITDKITSYVTALVTTYDELYALDASSDVTASTTYTGRHYHRMTPLNILQDLAQADTTDFWLNPWDGDSLDLVWNSTYAVAGAPNWTDSTILTWLDPRQALLDVLNKWWVEGFTSQDYKATGDDSDAASIASYGQRDGFVNNPELGSDKDCDDEADARVERTHDLPFHLSCAMNGYNTTTLGTVIEVDSTKLGLTDAYYIVTRKVYDSRRAFTTFFLTPREGTSYTLNPERHIDNLMSDITTRIAALESSLERGGRYTQSWS